MPGTQHLGLFVVSSVLLNITPGQDTLFIVGRSIAQGRRAGILSAFGIIAGCVIHTLAVASGLAAILAASVTLFTVLQWAGAAYLVYLGLAMLLERRAEPTQFQNFRAASATSIFCSGLLTNLLNPKVILFFLAFLPQFVDPATDSKFFAFLFLGALFIATGTIWALILVWLASLIRNAVQSRSGLSQVSKKLTGALFIGLGVRLAVSK